ncbi:MAG TPA: polysaccharide biosynthesis C-terminal domain-containing protein [Candidatus Limnocylindria bacterium]|nr:polysaccharide biosynthesis C-terminal domain-containing protein [Candidatus Limnocylindria bacterium]
MTNGLARGATLGLLTVVVERAVGFAVLLAAARVLVPAEFGVYTYLLAGIAPLQVMADQGLEIVAVAAMSRDGRRAGAVLAGVLVARGLLWLAVAVPMAALFLGGAGGGALREAALIASGLVLLGPSMPYRSLARARGEMGRVFTVMLADALASASAMMGVLLAGGGAGGLLAARVGASMLVTAVAARIAPVTPLVAPARAGAAAVELARDAWPLAANALLLSLVVRAGHLVLMAVAGASAVAYLGAAGRVAEMVSLLAEGVMLAVFPVMAASPERTGAIAAQVGRPLSLLVLWAVVTVSCASEMLVSILFGADYAPAAPALAVLAWGGLFAATGTLVLHGLVAGGRQRLLLATNLGAMTTAVALQLLLVPRFQLIGSAAATVAALAMGQILLALVPTSRPAVVASWRASLPALGLALSTLAAVSWLDVPEPWRGPAAALLFAAGAWGAGLVRPEDVALLARAATGARGR